MEQTSEVAFTQVGDGLRLPVRVLPGAGRTAVGGARGAALLVRVTAAPEDGKANAAVIAAVADALGLKKNAVALASGATSRRKVLELRGIAPEELARQLATLAPKRN